MYSFILQVNLLRRSYKNLLRNTRQFYTHLVLPLRVNISVAIKIKYNFLPRWAIYKHLFMSDDLRYPIGKFIPQAFSHQQKEVWLLDLKFLPSDLEGAVQNLDATQLQTPYRTGGWTVNQVVHHVADSHMNAYIRFKLGLTEDNPIIKTYDEKRWALLRDVETLPINISLTLLHALHKRWAGSHPGYA